MDNSDKARFTRRGVMLTGIAAGLTANASVAFARSYGVAPITTPPARHNISSFSIQNWRDHFDNLKNGAILADTNSRVLQYWSEDESVYKLYPTSVPLTNQLTRRGYTRVVRKVKGPSWAPTRAMKRRDPNLPDFVGPGPDNPLGAYALYLSWQYYRIHGTNDTRKIGRRSSNGCIGLYNDQIAELFKLAKIGTQVKLI